MNLQGHQQNQNLEITPVDNVELCYSHDIFVDGHPCENMKSNELDVLVHLVTDRASLFTDQRMSGLPIRTCEHTLDNSPTVSSSSSLKW